MRGLRCYRGLSRQEAEAPFQAVYHMAAYAENPSRLTLRTVFLKQGKGCIGQSRAGTGKPKSRLKTPARGGFPVVHPAQPFLHSVEGGDIGQLELKRLRPGKPHHEKHKTILGHKVYGVFFVLDIPICAKHKV